MRKCRAKPKHESHTNIYEIRQHSITTDLPKLSISKYCGSDSPLSPAETSILSKSVVIYLSTPFQTIICAQNTADPIDVVLFNCKQNITLINTFFFFFNAQPPKWLFMAGFRERKIPSLNISNSLSNTNCCWISRIHLYYSHRIPSLYVGLNYEKSNNITPAIYLF